jgi:hypothetical protein
MDSMIERVARAIAHAQLSRQYVGKLVTVGAVIEIDKIWPEFVPKACAAIGATREPTPEIKIHQNWPKWEDANLLRPELAAGSCHAWQAMIDAALAEKPEGGVGR